MSKCDNEFVHDFKAAVLEALDDLPPAHAVSSVSGKAPDKAWLEGFLAVILDDHRHPVWTLIDNYTSMYWQIGQYDGTTGGLNRAAEVLRTRAGQHYAGNKDDLARALRDGAELVDKEAVKAATMAANAKKDRGYGP